MSGEDRISRKIRLHLEAAAEHQRAANLSWYAAAAGAAGLFFVMVGSWLCWMFVVAAVILLVCAVPHGREGARLSKEADET